ncbi:uncharacterized protein LOC111412794 [Olea europaea var. sylvestris]|uniref:uncharacterized protein LOC111412794 n=1 Tax=Olea europaea var. sylvestris TaxID=158386 RepID=UPI000C1D8214|nr:uncharacterized protein LOC111412794 [Olea europaea var. sylvestris]
MVTSPSQHSLKDDGVARVLGPERRGRVRGLGFGATPSKLSALVHNHNLQTQVQELRDEIKELKALFQMKSKSVEQEDNPRDGSLNGSNNLQNRKCKLLSWFGKADVVAKVKSQKQIQVIWCIMYHLLMNVGEFGLMKRLIMSAYIILHVSFFFLKMH